jgi:hypothetical protein
MEASAVTINQIKKKRNTHTARGDRMNYPEDVGTKEVWSQELRDHRILTTADVDM